MPTWEVADRSSGAGVRTEGRRRRRIHEEGAAHAQLPPRPGTPAGYTRTVRWHSDGDATRLAVVSLREFPAATNTDARAGTHRDGPRW
jgi:hypothetical protein